MTSKFSGSARLAQSFSGFSSTKIWLGFGSNVFRMNFCGFGSDVQVSVETTAVIIVVRWLTHHSSPITTNSNQFSRSTKQVTPSASKTKVNSENTVIHAHIATGTRLDTIK